MSNYIKYEDYQAIQNCKNQGFNKRQTALKIKMQQGTVLKYWDISEEEYFNLTYDNINDLQQYKQFLTDILKSNPTIKNTVLLLKIKEQFNAENIKQATFYRYIKKLRAELGLEQKNVRKFMLVEHKNPGEEMQVDMGEKYIFDIYGNKQKVYFTAFILSYSRMRFCYFQNRAFKTQDFIKAHENAFKYYGGRTQMLMYDQAKIVIADEMVGNIIFAKEFKEYINHVGFSVYLCKKRDPSTKGKIENTVRVIKMNFLESRQYNGINNLNSEALRWLDDFCNATLNAHTLKSPSELFEIERKHLIQTKPYKNLNEKIAVVKETNTILYKNNHYSVPVGLYKKGDRVLVKEIADSLQIYSVDTNKLICSHKISNEKGQIIQTNKFEYSTHMQDQLLKLLDNDERLLKFLEGVKLAKPRYMHEQCLLFKKVYDNFTKEELFEAIEHCNNYQKFCAIEIIVFLVMRYGIERVRKVINYRTKYNYIDRARRLQIELYGGKDNG